jgi:hypothetical protein
VASISHCLKALDLTKSAHAGEQSRELPESGPEPPRDGDCFFRERQGPYRITEPDLRRCHRCEHAAFGYPKSTFPSDRQRRSQNFERLAPCAVYTFASPMCKKAEDSCELPARPLGIVDDLPGMRQRMRRLARDLTSKGVMAVRADERQQ